MSKNKVRLQFTASDFRDNPELLELLKILIDNEIGAKIEITVQDAARLKAGSTDYKASIPTDTVEADPSPQLELDLSASKLDRPTDKGTGPQESDSIDRERELGYAASLVRALKDRFSAEEIRRLAEALLRSLLV